MNLFEIVKASVSVPEAARVYGLDVTRHNMTRCPFHDDRHPSLKLNPDFYYCFGCGARGDVIDLAAGLFDLSPYEAARKIATDFGNKKKLTKWQDAYWEHMVKTFPELERGVSASETGRDYIPPRVFKEMTRLNKQREKQEELLFEVNAFNVKVKADEIGKVLDKYIPNVEKMSAQVRKYSRAFGEMKAEKAALETANEALTAELKESQQESVLKRMADLQLRRDYDAAVSILERIPPEVLEAYAPDNRGNRSKTKGRDTDVRD